MSPGFQIILQVLKTLSAQTQSSHITFPYIPELKGRKCEPSFSPCMAKMDRHLPGGWSLRFTVPGEPHEKAISGLALDSGCLLDPAMSF